jgi:hypothetical protein
MIPTMHLRWFYGVLQQWWVQEDDSHPERNHWLEQVPRMLAPPQYFKGKGEWRDVEAQDGSA